MAKYNVKATIIEEGRIRVRVITGPDSLAKQFADQARVSAEESAQSALNAAESENNAGTSETNALQSATLSQSWAEGTEPGGEGTKSSKGHAEDASQSASDAETSKNEITDKIDFTGAQEGDLYRVNAQGVAVPVKENRILRFQNVLSSIHPSQVQAWDDFQDNPGEQNGRLSASGHQWLVIDRVLGDNSGLGYDGVFSVANSQSRNATTIQNKIQVLPVTERNGLFAEGLFSWGNNTTNFHVIFFNSVTKDLIQITFAEGYSLTQIVGGVSTQLASESSTALAPISSNSKTGGTFEISVTRLQSISEYHIGFKVAGLIGGFRSGAGDFFSIMDSFTHFGTGGFRGSSLNGIRIYKMWE